MFKGRCEDIERRDKDVQGESRSNVNKGEAHSKQVDHCSKQIASRHPLAQLQSETLVYQVSMPSMPPHQIEQDHGDKYCSTVNQSCRVLLPALLCFHLSLRSLHLLLCYILKYM